MIVVLIGVSGSGKTTVGKALAADLMWPFYDADDFHPTGNVARMAAGQPLTDDDRAPWLAELTRMMSAIDTRGEHAVLACSGLKEAYRRQLSRAGDVRFVHLRGDEATIAARLAARSAHYMPPSLLASQFAILEEPLDAIVVDIRLPVQEQVAAIRRQLSATRYAA